MEQDVKQLAEQLYNGDENRCKPTWEQLEHKGACQTLWTERALRQIEQQVLDTYNDYVEAGRLL